MLSFTANLSGWHMSFLNYCKQNKKVCRKEKRQK